MTVHAAWSSPVRIIKVVVHKRGAEGELTLANQDRVLVYKARLVGLAERASREQKEVELYLVRSATGNTYCTDIRFPVWHP